MFEITLHGVRGSYPAIGEDFTKYGGNTTCFEINTESIRIIIDTGTGFQNVQLNGSSKPTYIFYTHFHHDHIQGLGNNIDLFKTKNPINLCSAAVDKGELKKILTSYFSPRFFPINMFTELHNLHFCNFYEIKKEIAQELTIDFVKLNHPGGATGYKIQTDKVSVVFLFDNEITDETEKKLIPFCENMNIVFWDGMFTDQEYRTKKGWGHSTIEQGRRFSKKTKSKKLYICHHSPSRKDSEIDILAELNPEDVIFASEKMQIKL